MLKDCQNCVRVLMYLAIILVAAIPAGAAQRTFVSAGSGNDANPCTRTSPCRNFSPAIAQTDDGGEVVVLDSGGYGAVTIAKSVSLIAPAGVYAGVTGFSGAAIELTQFTSIVILKGLSLNGQGGVTGIKATDVNTVHVENVTISGFSGNGIEALGFTGLFIKDTIVRNCGGSGILIDPPDGTGSQKVSIDRARLEKNGVHGLLALAGALVTVRDTLAAANSTTSFHFANLGTGNPRLDASVENSTASHSSFGFVAEEGAHVSIRNSAAIRTSNRGFWVHSNNSEMVVSGCLAHEGQFGFRAGFLGGGSGGTSSMAVSNSTASNNTEVGIYAESGGRMRIFGNVVTGNSVGLQNQGSSTIFESFGHNAVHANLADTSGTITQVPTM